VIEADVIPNQIIEHSRELHRMALMIDGSRTESLINTSLIRKK